MKIVVGIPCFNEIDYIKQRIDDLLLTDHDHIVFLDDGSTDGGYEELLQYEKKYSHIHVFRNEKNSIKNYSLNRWMVLAKYCATFEPDWIEMRAMDQTYSKAFYAINGKSLFRERLEYYMDKDINMICFPIVNLWRSKWWFRSDGIWGNAVITSVSNSCWKHNSGWEFVGPYRVSVAHQGAHRPNRFNGSMKVASINFVSDKQPLPLVVLHHGMSSHKKIANKLNRQFRYSLNLDGQAIGMPSIKNPPHPSQWNGYNGYKLAHEQFLKLTRVRKEWVLGEVPDAPLPEIKSFFDVIVKYNESVANQHRELYKKLDRTEIEYDLFKQFN